MTKRPLTPEERKLWRESNRLTTVKIPVEEDEVEEVPAAKIAAPKASVPAPLPIAKPRPLSALKGLSAREAKRAFKPHDLGASLDLHGLTKLEAYARVEAFIRQQHRLGRRHVAIITGKGRGSETGVLRTNLPHWLNEPALRPLISAFTYAKPEKGGAGVTHVLLKSR